MEKQLLSSVSPSRRLPPPEHLLHHCSTTINSSVQISCKLPKQTSVPTSAPQHTHTHRSPKFRPPYEQHTLPESLSNTLTILYWYPRHDLDGNRQAQPLCVLDLTAADRNACFPVFPSKNGSADANLVNDKLLMSLSTAWFTPVWFTSFHGDTLLPTCTLTPMLSALSKWTG